MDATRTVMRRIVKGLTEAVVADDVTIHKADDIESVEFYFELGHGNEFYHTSEFDIDTTDPMSHEIWALVHGRIDRHQQVQEDELEFDPNDEEAMREYLEEEGELPVWTHNQIWSHLKVDEHWKGHYEGDTGRLSVVNPGFKLTGQLLGMLRAAFHPTEIHVF